MTLSEGRNPQGVSIRAATKSYGMFNALDAVSLEIAEGEFFSILGPSGSGKTTLLGILGGFVMPTSGSIHVGPRDITFEPPHRRDIGIVFQNYALFPHMTVGENITFPLRARRIARSEWPGKLRAALEMVDLGGYQNRKIHELSGGQRQRVALARATVFEPRLILMDEPLSALDKQLRENMQLELMHLHRRLKATIIYVTHDQREALTMSDKVAIMSKGRLVQVDTPRRLHDNPVNAFVARFIGEATLIDVARTGDRTVSLGCLTLTSAHKIPKASDLKLVVHCEKLFIAEPGEAGGMNQLSGTVTENIYQGESVRVFVKLDVGGELSFRLPSNHKGRSHLRQPGEAVTVSLHPDDTVVVPEAN